MSFWDKVLFWKKDEENDKIEALAHQEIKEPAADLWSDKLSEEEKTVFPASGRLPIPGALAASESPIDKKYLKNRDLELIDSKLDTIKAILTSLEQRMLNLEKAAGIEEKRRLW